MFRGGKCIREALASIVNQSYRNFEIVIVDNNASEETRGIAYEFLEKYPNIIRIVLEKEQGSPFAKNTGIRESRGEFIAFLEDDDVMLENRLEKQLQKIQEVPHASLVYCLVNHISFDGREILKKDHVNKPEFWAELLFKDDPSYRENPLVNPFPSSIFFRKSLSTKIGGFDTKFSPVVLDDTDFNLRMYEQGPFARVNEALTNYRVSSRELFLLKRKGITDWIRIRSNLSYFYSKWAIRYFDPKDSRKVEAFKKIQSQWIREFAKELFAYRDGVKPGRYMLERSIKANPYDIKNWLYMLRSYYPEKLFLKSFHLERLEEEKIMEKIDYHFLESLYR